LVLSILAENAVTLIMTTVLLCFKGFFAAYPQISRRLSRIFYVGSRRSNNYKSRPAG